MTDTGVKLPLSFYCRTDVVQVARDLLGKVLVSDIDGLRTAGRITEVEAYRAPEDRASHAWGNRLTPRTRIMFEEGGRAYIYLCYGIHHLFNVVTGPEGTAHAVLIRTLAPLEGVETMLRRRKMTWDEKMNLPPQLTAGPGTLSKALGLHTALTGQSFFEAGAPFWIEDRNYPLREADIAAGPRIGVAYAGAWAAREWRFWIHG